MKNINSAEVLGGRGKCLSTDTMNYCAGHSLPKAPPSEECIQVWNDPCSSHPAMEPYDIMQFSLKECCLCLNSTVDMETKRMESDVWKALHKAFRLAFEKYPGTPLPQTPPSLPSPVRKQINLSNGTGIKVLPH